MERLTAEDQIMLWGDELWPQEIGALAILDGTSLLDPTGRVRIEVVRQAMEARLHLVPRFRQILQVPCRGLGRPLWIDAPAFDLADHVGVLPLPDPAGEAQLLIATERLRSQRLDRSRPLWQMWFLPGLPGRQVGMFVKMHHAVADGIAGVATVGAFLDAVPHRPGAPTPTWTPRPAPSARDLFVDNVAGHVTDLADTFSTLTRPVTIARHLRVGWSAARVLSAGQPTPDTSLNRRVGAHRTLALIRGSLDQIRPVAHAHDATVNDMLLAATAGGLRELVRSRGEPIDDLTLPVYVPATLRQPRGRDRARGNLVAQMVVPLPIGESDPGRRLARIATETAARKAEPHASVGSVLRSRLVRRALLKVLDSHPVNVTSADIPGPRRPLYLAGARLLEVFPVLPLIANVSLGVGGLSYADQFNITVVADRDAYPDLDILVMGMWNELRALTTYASGTARHPS